MTRKEFIMSSAAFAATSGCATRKGLDCLAAACDDYESIQREIDAVKPADYNAYKLDGDCRDLAALQRLEDAFDRVATEVRETVVTDKPAVWFVYNMGIVVKTPETCFSVDLRHRRGHELAPLLDFALITHNHGDHYTDELYAAMNGAGKTVISNFKDNYGAKNWKKNGGYTRAQKTFTIKDVTIKTALTDHNDYLVDFTTAFEITSHDYTIFHSGDCSNVRKLNPSVTPDLWFVHPYCGMKTASGVKKFFPKKTVIAHLNELGHGKWRWTWAQGFKAKDAAEAEGGAAIVPLWGERIV